MAGKLRGAASLQFNDRRPVPPEWMGGVLVWNYVAPMLTWEVVTEQRAAKPRETETSADPNALNQLLLTFGQARSKSEMGAMGCSGRSAKRSAGFTRPISRSIRRTTLFKFALDSARPTKVRKAAEPDVRNAAKEITS